MLIPLAWASTTLLKQLYLKVTAVSYRAVRSNISDMAACFACRLCHHSGDDVTAWSAAHRNGGDGEGGGRKSELAFRLSSFVFRLLSFSFVAVNRSLIFPLPFKVFCILCGWALNFLNPISEKMRFRFWFLWSSVSCFVFSRAREKTVECATSFGVAGCLFVSKGIERNPFLSPRSAAFLIGRVSCTRQLLDNSVERLAAHGYCMYSVPCSR